MYDEQQKRWTVDLAALRSLLEERPNTKLIVMNFPHNPTGKTVSVFSYDTSGLCLTNDELKAVMTLASEFGCYVFSDEMYIHLTHDSDVEIPSAAELYGKEFEYPCSHPSYPNAISLNGMSKSFSLPGLRIGWLVTQNKTFLKIAQKWKDYTTICGSAPSEILSIAALRNKFVSLSTMLNPPEILSSHETVLSSTPTSIS